MNLSTCNYFIQYYQILSKRKRISVGLKGSSYLVRGIHFYFKISAFAEKGMGSVSGGIFLQKNLGGHSAAVIFDRTILEAYNLLGSL